MEVGTIFDKNNRQSGGKIVIKTTVTKIWPQTDYSVTCDTIDTIPSCLLRRTIRKTQS